MCVEKGNCRLPVNLVWGGVVTTVAALAAICYLAAHRPDEQTAAIAAAVAALLGPALTLFGVVMHQRSRL